MVRIPGLVHSHVCGTANLSPPVLCSRRIGHGCIPFFIMSKIFGIVCSWNGLGRWWWKNCYIVDSIMASTTDACMDWSRDGAEFIVGFELNIFNNGNPNWVLLFYKLFVMIVLWKKPRFANSLLLVLHVRYGINQVLHQQQREKDFFYRDDTIKKNQQKFKTTIGNMVDINMTTQKNEERKELASMFFTTYLFTVRGTMTELSMI